MGPLVSAEQLSRALRLLESGFSEGATAIAGGQQERGRQGYFVEPTVLVNDPRRYEGGAGRNFRPRGDGDAVQRSRKKFCPAANNSEYGLAAAVWTQGHRQGPPPPRNISRGRYGVDQLLQTFFERGTLRSVATNNPDGGVQMGHDVLTITTQ